VTVLCAIRNVQYFSYNKSLHQNCTKCCNQTACTGRFSSAVLV